MSKAVILSARRTPIGKFGGAMSSFSATELGATAIKAAVEQAKISTDVVDEVIMGNVLSAGIGQAPSRQAALLAGLPISVAALSVNKVCGSGLKAVILADQAIRAGDAEIIVAGGMESMSRAPYLQQRDDVRFGDRKLVDSMLHDGLTCSFSHRSMGDLAESLATADGITREVQDEYAAESHRRAVAARREGVFSNEIIPVAVSRKNEMTTVAKDEGPREDTTLDRLASLRPAFTDDGTVTAGNASMISDGAAALVVASEGVAQTHGWTPLARIVASATVGTDPEDLFVAPVAAVEKVVGCADMQIDDIDLFEISEAFAAQMIACLRRLKLTTDRVNIHGGAIALGHPIGASGARVLVTLVHALKQRNARYGLATLCLGGGNAVAMIVERMG